MCAYPDEAKAETEIFKSNIMETNYLIAEFMGMSLGGDGWFDYEGVLGENESYLDLKFHESWDWLIPVVDKCYEVAESVEQCKVIRHALEETDKEYLYRAVVRFIQKNTDTEKMMKMRIADMDNDLN